MKNKAVKNLIFLGALVFSFLALNNASAYGSGYSLSVVDLNPPTYANYNNSYTSSGYLYDQNAYLQQPPYTYVAPAPAPVKYVPQANYQYTNTQQYSNTQPYANTYTNTQTNTVRTVKAPVSSTTPNTGNYINFDGNQNMLGGAAYYGGYGQVAPMQNVNDNGVTALSVAGSGSFLPSSIFQWFLFILLVLAIIIVARMITKKREEAHVAH